MRPLALFDVDNTLVDRAEGFRRWALEFCSRWRLDTDQLPWLEEADGDGLTPKDVFFERVRERFGIREPAASLRDDYRTRKPALIPPCPGVLDGLERLRARGWRIGLVTNGEADVQLATITAGGLAERVDGWAISGAEGVRKPARRLFELAAERCGAVLAPEAWMVGDSLAADVRGGREAGLRTIWIDRGRLLPSDAPQPDFVVSDGAAAIELLIRERTRC